MSSMGAFDVNINRSACRRQSKCMFITLFSLTIDTYVRKSLTVGSACGTFTELFAKIKAIDAKHGKFDFVLCTGDFFGPPPDGEDSQPSSEIVKLLEGEIEGFWSVLLMQHRILKVSYFCHDPQLRWNASSCKESILCPLR